MLSLLRQRVPAGASTSPLRLAASRYLATLTPPPSLSEGEKTIFAKLTDQFSPSELQVADVSGLCSALDTLQNVPLIGNMLLGGCGSFYAITIASEAFKGLPIVKQHRLVNDTLKKEIEGIHGLQVTPL